MSDLSPFIEAIKQAIPVEQLVGQRVQLKRRGKNLLGLCPFHAEKTPSFNVSPDRESFKCFGCGEYGDIISFVMKLDGLEFMEAVRVLADQAGVQLPERPGRKTDRADTDRKKQAREALAHARRLYHEALASPAAEGARRYLADRAVSEDMMRAFQLGWAPNENDWLVARLIKQGYEPEVLEFAGLALRSQRDGSWVDRFRERLMFPVVEPGERTVGFGGRFLPGSWADQNNRGKYVNSPESPLFPKRRLLYGADRLAQGLRDAPELPILLTEGYLDVIMLHQAGMPTAVAALGTAFSEENARRILRHKHPVALLLDGDQAGRQAARRAASHLVKEGVEVRVVDLPEGSDPADLVQDGRAQELRERVQKAWDIIDWRLAAWSQHEDLRDPQIKSKAAKEMAFWVQATPNPVLAETWLRTICDRLGVSEQALRRLLGPSPGPASANGASQLNSPTPGPDSKPVSPEQILHQNEQHVVQPLLVDPSLFPAYQERLKALKLEDECASQVLKWCFAQREQGEDCALDLAMSAFREPPVAIWLDQIRTFTLQENRLEMNPKVAMEAALDALPGNRERADTARGSSDDDLRRFFRRGRWSPLDEGND